MREQRRGTHVDIVYVIARAQSCSPQRATALLAHGDVRLNGKTLSLCDRRHARIDLAGAHVEAGSMDFHIDEEGRSIISRQRRALTSPAQ